MAQSVQVKTTYAKSSTSTGLLNPITLKQEIATAGIAVGINSINEEGTNFTVDFADLITAAQITTIDGVVAAHTGANFDYTQSMTSMSDSTDDSGNWITKGSAINVGPLPAGRFIVQAQCEIQLVSQVASLGVQARLTVGGSQVTIDSWDVNQPHASVLNYTVDVVAGTVATLAIQFRRIGVSGTGVICRNARMFVTKSDS